MAIGIDDDDFDAYEGNEQDTLTQDINHYDDDNFDELSQQSSKSNLIDELLKDKGISDSSKIKFENDEGEIEEVDWNSLSSEEQLNILKSKDEPIYNNDYDLDESEIQLINAIRKGNMTPQEYINFIQRDSINKCLH